MKGETISGRYHYTSEFNPTSGIKEKYGFSFNKKDKNFNMN